MRLCDFLVKQVSFVQEEDGGRLLEPMIREDSLEQCEALLQPILRKEGRNVFDKGQIFGNICFFF